LSGGDENESDEEIESLIVTSSILVKKILIYNILFKKQIVTTFSIINPNPNFVIKNNNFFKMVPFQNKIK